MPRSRRNPPVRFAVREPSVLDKPGIFRCPEWCPDGCRRCNEQGFIDCAHKFSDLGESYTYPGAPEAGRFAKCGRCGSDVRDPREHAGENAVDSFHAQRDSRDDAAPPSQNNASV